jgi:hypothetical protein
VRGAATRAALAWILPALAVAWGDTVILQLQVLEGEGAVFAASSRALKPVIVRVTDETGAPVEGAVVSFRLPEEGVTGLFQNGLKTDMALSGPDGRAAAPNIAWGPLAGPARLRVTAAVNEARAGVLIAVYVSADNVAVAGASASPASSILSTPFGRAPAPQLKRKGRWRWAAAAAAGVGAGVIFALVKGAGSSGSANPVSGPSVSIGQPTISIGSRP